MNLLPLTIALIIMPMGRGGIIFIPDSNSGGGSGGGSCDATCAFWLIIVVAAIIGSFIGFLIWDSRR